jgi:hypothetical protein
MAFGRARADDKENSKTAAHGKKPLSAKERDILAAMASDSESDDETARVLAREELAAIPPSALSWGDEDDEDDATRASKPRKQASSSRRGGWLARLNTAREQKEASVRDLSRAERRAANDAEKRQKKQAAALGANKNEANGTVEPVSYVGNVRNAEVSRLLSVAKRVVAATLLAFFATFVALVAAVYLDSNRPDLWPPIWRLRGGLGLTVAESLAFAYALAGKAAARIAFETRGVADAALAEAAAAVAAAVATARVAAASVAAEARWARDAAERLMRDTGTFVAAKAGR